MFGEEGFHLILTSISERRATGGEIDCGGKGGGAIEWMIELLGLRTLDVRVTNKWRLSKSSFGSVRAGNRFG